MAFLLACVFLFVRETSARPTEQTDSPTQGNLQTLFRLVMQTPRADSGNLSSSLSCVELSAHRSPVLHLKNRSLASFPSCLPAILEQLDLSDNLLPEFSGQRAAYLPELQVLSLGRNKIQQVTWGDPGNLDKLQILDLSFNLLSSVPSCDTSSLGDLKVLSLAGNPIMEIQAFAFPCYPQLQFLNLSSTLLGQDGKDGIQESAFAVNFLHGDTIETVGNSLTTLDLSATFLDRIGLKWLKDLPRLTSLHLKQMSRLRSLDAAVFVHAPHLKELNCQDSYILSEVKTESFSQTPDVSFLMFQNCNLSSLNPWNRSSADNLLINLYGNPLECRCEMSWLLDEPERIVLQRASETMCYTRPEVNIAPRSMTLLRFNDECQSNRTTHSTPELKMDNLDSTRSSITTKTLPESGSLPQRWAHISVAPQSIAMTRGDLTTQEATQADVLAFKEKPVYKSTKRPSTTATLTTPSAVLGIASAKQTVGVTTQMDPRSHDGTTAESRVHSEGTSNNSAPSTLAAAPSKTSSSLVPSALFIPQDMVSSTSAKPPTQNPTNSTARPNPAPTDIPLYYVDYSDYKDRQEESEVQTIGPCAYDPCRHLQKPCSELQELSLCLCPGISDEFTIPEPPRLHEVSEIRDTSAEIRWCAPNSYVRFYRIAYRLKGGVHKDIVTPEIYPTAREYTLLNLRPGFNYQVCIIASNKAGSSQTKGHNAPCATFATKSNFKSSFAVLGTMSGLLLIATIFTSGCLCKRHKIPRPEQSNTHLVSYRNPAFDDSSK